MKYFYAIALSLVLALAAPLLANAQAQAAITGVEVQLLENGHEQVRFITSRPLTLGKLFQLPNPARVVVDIPAVPVTGIALPPDYRGTLLAGIRFGQFDPKTARLVIDLATPVKVVGTHGGSPLVIELVANGPVATANMAALAPAPATPVLAASDADDADDGAAPSPSPSPSPFVKVAPATKPLASKKPGAAASASKPNPHSTEKSAKPEPLSAEEKKPLVVIDAGHGGQDPGALGLHETHEKDVTLNFARALRSALLHTGRYRVLLTRDDDTFVSLVERVNMARKAKGSIFVSFHADSNPRPEARGLSLYTLSETASDDEAAALADHENKADVIQGMDLSNADADVASILIDLTQRETMNKSAVLANAVVESLHGKINRLPKTHRFAGFRVLKAPDIPSTLIELGFLSNVADERLLLSPEYRDLVVMSVARGIDRYLAGE